MSYKFQKEVNETLAHFASFSNAMILFPGQALCASSETRSVTAYSDVEVDLPDSVDDEVGLPIWNIKSFYGIIKLFESNGDYDAEFHPDRIIFNSTDGRFTQEYFLSDPVLLEGLAPKPSKVEKYLSIDPIMTFDLDESVFKNFKAGMATSDSNTIGIRSKDGKIILHSSQFDDQGNETKNSSVFRFNTGVSTNENFNIGFARESFIILPGSYEVRIHNKFIVFKGEVVSYVFALATWSEI